MAAKLKGKLDMRRLMREQRETLRSKKKINSPLAKYSSTGQLYCVLCNAPVKNDLLWEAHVQGKKHKEMLAELKSRKQDSGAGNISKSSNHLATAKKEQTFVKPVVLSKRKVSEQEQVQDEKLLKKPKVSQVMTSSSLPPDFFDNSSSKSLVDAASSDESDEEEERARQDTPESSGLPADFFDSSEKNQSKTMGEAEAKSDPSSKSETTESLPEGFFDDPKLDAKARKVEYKDPIEEEWEKFQKVMQMENQVSEALVDVDDEESRIDRQLTELSEQRLYFLRADALRDKQTVIKDELFKRASKRRKVADEQNDSGSDSEDFEEFLDWRAKKAL